MKIIGITGGIGYGKTTLSGYLEAAAESALQIETSSLIIETVNALRQQSAETPHPDDPAAINAWLTPLAGILEQRMHVSVPADAFTFDANMLLQHDAAVAKLLDYLRLVEGKPELQRIPIDGNNKDEFRAILQWLGGYCVMHVNDHIWFGELLRRVQQANAELVIISGVRFPADAEIVHGAGGRIVEIMRPNLDAIDLDDVTERQRYEVPADAVLLNDGSVKQLQACSQVLYDDLMSSKLRATYRASQF